MSLTSLPTISISSGAVVTLVGYFYQRRKYAQSLASQLELESFSKYLRRGLGYRLARFLRPRAAAKLSLREFALNRLAASHAKVFVPAAVPVEVPLDEMFVPLTALSSAQDRVSASQVAFGDYRRVLLVGDPGSGKSTLVRRMYRDICRRAITFTWIADIPVLVELKNLDQQLESKGESHTESLAEFVRRQVTTVRTYSGDDLYESFLDAGRITVLLDGLDEVKTTDFDTISQEIIRLCDHLARRNERNRIIVTTRRQLYVNLPEDFLSSFETHLTLEPFTADDMYEFLQKWPYKKDPDQELGRIFGNLVSQPNIRNMCQTPLILAMYVATDQLTGGEGLPETRPDFYRAVTDELLVRRRGRQLGLMTGLNLLRRNRQQLLGRLALEHLLDAKQSRNTIHWDTAVKIVQEQEAISSQEAGQRLRELSRDTGLFTEERREESLRFIHLTFCEFLAAQAIVQGKTQAWEVITRGVESESDAGRIGSKRFVERFSEVIVFAAALEKNEQIRRERIRWGVQSGNVDIALRTILDSQPYDDEFVLLELERVANEVANTPEDARDENWFYLFRRVAMLLRDRELVEGAVSGRKVDLLTPFFLRTVGDSSASFSQLFVSYMRLDPAGALDLAHSMKIETVTEYPHLLAKALDEPAVLAHALGQFRKSTEGTRAWASVLAVGTLYHSSVVQRLASMKVQDELDQRVRQGGRRRGWQRSWIMRGSLLGTVLEAGCRWPGSSRAMALMATAPVRTRRLTERLCNITVLEYLTAAVISMALLYVLGRQRDVLTMWWSIGSLGVGVGIAFLLWRARQRRWNYATAWLLQARAAFEKVPDFSSFTEAKTARTLDLLRAVRRQKLVDLFEYSLWDALARNLPLPMVTEWSPNLRLKTLVYVLPYHLSLEVGDRAPHSPPLQ